MTDSLPPRPHPEHLRGQAKLLLAEWRAGARDAAQAFIDHLPKARGLSMAEARKAPFRLADAQSVIARRAGFQSWAALTRHVALLRALEGEWHFEALQINGQDMPRMAYGQSRLLIDGDRFRMESPEANYDGRFLIDAVVRPMRIDMAFTEGPEADNTAYGIFTLDGDSLTICLGLVGSPRPSAFATSAGSGHALERLRRSSGARPAGVTGGLAKPSANVETALVSEADAAAFDVPVTPLLRRLEGEWSPVQLVTDGQPMPGEWLRFGSRTSRGNEVRVVFGGQLMVHAKVRIDDRVAPIAVDYLHLGGADAGKVSHGIMECLGEEVRFLMAPIGQPRPAGFAAPGGRGTLSQWKRRAEPA